MSTVVIKIMNLLETQQKQQSDLAEYLGLKSYVVSEWKSGKTRSYRKYINKIADFFGVDAEYFDLENDTEFFQPRNSSKNPTPQDHTVVQIIEIYNKLSLKNKGRVIEYITTLEESVNKKDSLEEAGE